MEATGWPRWSESGWRLGAELGKGSFARVCEATNQRSGDKAAVKVIYKDHDDNTPEVIESELAALSIISQRLQFSNSFVKSRQVLEDMYNTYIVMDLCTGGTLAKMLEEGTPIDETLTRSIIRQVLEALSELHEAQVVHCDIKPENILFHEANDFSSIKITDFGFSLHERSDPEQPLMGSPHYVAPEVLQHRRYTPACDLWAVGVATYKMICGKVPFSTDDKIIQNPLRFYDEVWEQVSSSAKDFIRKCLSKDSRTRPAAADLLLDPWFGGVSKANGSAPSTPKRLRSVATPMCPTTPIVVTPKAVANLRRHPSLSSKNSTLESLGICLSPGTPLSPAADLFNAGQRCPSSPPQAPRWKLYRRSSEKDATFEEALDMIASERLSSKAEDQLAGLETPAEDQLAGPKTPAGPNTPDKDEGIISTELVDCVTALKDCRLSKSVTFAKLHRSPSKARRVPVARPAQEDDSDDDDDNDDYLWKLPTSRASPRDGSSRCTGHSDTAAPEGSRLTRRQIGLNRAKHSRHMDRRISLMLLGRGYK